jgi:hypothetical protein
MIRSAAAVAAVLVLHTGLALADQPEPGASPSPSPPASSAEPSSPAPSAPRAPRPRPAFVPPPAAAGPYGYAYPYTYAITPPADPPAPRPPRLVPYEGGPIPEGAKLTRSYDPLLLGLGGGLLGGLWVVNVIDAVMNCPPGREAKECQSNTAWLYIPVAGPFLAAADKAATYGGRNLAILDGFLQVGAAATLIVGLATPKPMLEYKRGPGSAARSTSAPTLHFAPSAPGALAGLSFGGRM